MKRLATVTMVALLAVGLLGACGSDEDAAEGSSSVSASPSPTPTPAPVVWAGEVCVERDRLGAAVSSLGRNLSYDITSDRSALDQIDRQLRLQVLAVGDAANGLVAALQGVPVDFQAANDTVVEVTKAKDDAQEAVDEVTARLDAMVSADNVLAGVAEAGNALVAAKAAFEAGQALVGSVGDSLSSANEEMQAAFDAAPQCQDASASATAS